MHYTPPENVASGNADEAQWKKYPLIFRENSNNWEAGTGADFGSLDRCAAVIDHNWRVIWNADHADGVNFPRLNLSAVTLPKTGRGWIYADRQWAYLTNVVVNGQPSTAAKLTATPLIDVRTVDADVAAADGDLVGHLNVTVSQGRFVYRIGWTGPPGDIQELGWVFDAPGTADPFSWHRNAYWSYYPPTHIGRPAGTAPPDSILKDPTRWSRPAGPLEDALPPVKDVAA